MITIKPPEKWDETIASHAQAHFLQTRAWAEIKGKYGWTPWYLQEGDPSSPTIALILARRLSLLGVNTPFKVLYSPRGPLTHWEDAKNRDDVLGILESLAKTQKAFFFKIDPEAVTGLGVPENEAYTGQHHGLALQQDLLRRGWRFSAQQIQFRNTIMLNLEGDTENWLARMKQKTRYNLRLAERKGVYVSQGDKNDFPTLYRLYAETSLRDGFVIRAQQYYYNVWEKFLDKGMANILIARVGDTPVAALILFHLGQRSWYFYGMSSESHRYLMPNYLLQWEAMLLAKKMGCVTYDLWGAPDDFVEKDPLWGVYRFKEGLGGQVVRTIGAWDYVPYPNLYSLYNIIIPKILNILRKRRIQNTRLE